MRVGSVEVRNIKNNLNVRNSRGIQSPSIALSHGVDTVSFSGRDSIDEPFRIGLSLNELRTRTSPEYFEEIQLLGTNSSEFEGLILGDKMAVSHLTRAAYILDEVYQKQDHPSNIDFRNWLGEKALEGDESAELAAKLYAGAKGIITTDNSGQKVNLMKGEKELAGCGVWPFNIKIDEIKQILNKMLDDNQIEEVRAILSPRTVVKRDKSKLRAIDYAEEYKEEYKAAALELEEAAKRSTNEQFNEYLRYQAAALRAKGPTTEAYADKKWSELQDTPLEFTIARESYAETVTDTLLKDTVFAARLKAKGIVAQSKEFIGCRVGIVNKKGTDELLKMRKYLHLIPANMPLRDSYKQNLSRGKQTMVDVDLIALAGDSGAYRAGIGLAQNLPNRGSLALDMGSGTRNVHHRQIRFRKQKILEKLAEQILVPELAENFNSQGYHWFVQAHESTHNAGPNIIESHIGNYRSILEECKADMGIDIFREFVKAGFYTPKQKQEAFTAFIVDLFWQLSGKPDLDDAHRVRAVMQINHYIEEGAIIVKKKKEGLSGLFDSQKTIDIDFTRMEAATRSLFEKVVKVQLSDNYAAAESLVKEKFKWTKDMEAISKTVKEVYATLNAVIKSPLAESLLNSHYLKL